MFETSIREGKLPPDYSGTDDYQVVLSLNGEVRDPRFLRFLEEIGRETQEPFTTEDLLVLDCIHRDEPLPEVLRARLPRLRELGIIETLGRGRGMSYILSRRFYRFVGQSGRYTSKLGLDREANKMLLLRHIEDNATTGTQMGELTQVLPALIPKNVQRLVYKLRDEQRIHMTGRTSTARWYPGPAPDANDESHLKG
jgi:ATP-dependent DNA helicase RecG